MIESWRAIPGFPGYEVSDLGRVRSVRGKCPRILRQRRAGNGYMNIAIRDAAGRNRCWAIHVLVLTVFVGPRPEGMQACHFPDRDHANNALPNLRWDTRRANWNDMRVHGTAPTGVRHGMHGVRVLGTANPAARLTKAAVRRIRQLSERGWSQRRIAADCGVHQTSVGRIVRRERWEHVP